MNLKLQSDQFFSINLPGKSLKIFLLYLLIWKSNFLLSFLYIIISFKNKLLIISSLSSISLFSFLIYNNPGFLCINCFKSSFVIRLIIQ